LADNLIGTFETGELLEGLNQSLRPRRFLLERVFGGNFRAFETQHVLVDWKKGRRRMAPFINHRIGGKLVERTSWATNIYTPPMIGPRDIYTGEGAMGRAFGEVIGGSMSPTDRDAAAMADALGEHDDLITRRIEWMAAQLLATGVIPIVGDGVEDTIDVGFDHTDTLSGTSCWGESASDIRGDLRRWALSILQRTGILPDTCILGLDAVTAFSKDANLKEELDVRNLMIGSATQQNLPNGAMYLGTIDGIEVFGYPEWYIDDTTGVETAMIPADAAILFPSAGRNPGARIVYGAFYDVEDRTTYVGPRIPRTWTDKGANCRYTEVISRPVPVIPDSDSWLVAKVIE
jgi:hypothetical protein